MADVKVPGGGDWIVNDVQAPGGKVTLDPTGVFMADEPACTDPGCRRGPHATGLHMSRTWDSNTATEIIDEWGFVTLEDGTEHKVKP